MVRLVGRLWFHRVLAKSLRICTLIIVSHSSSLLDHLSHTPSCDLSSYAAAKRIVSLGAFQTVVVVLVMFAEYCLRRIYLIEAKQPDSYKPRLNTLPAAFTECQVCVRRSQDVPPYTTAMAPSSFNARNATSPLRSTSIHGPKWRIRYVSKRKSQ